MKRIIPFTRYFLPAVLVSSALILFGLFGFFTKGFNLGVDFQAGVNQTVQLAYPVGSISYKGKGNAEMTVSETAITLVFSGAETDSKTVVINYKDNPTVADLAKALEALPEVKVQLEAGQENSASSLLVPTYQGNTLINLKPALLHRLPASDGERFASIDKVREAVKDMGRVSVQTINPASQQRFMIRVQDEGKDSRFTETARAGIISGLENAFGTNRVVEVKTDFVGARFSQGLTQQSIFLVLATMVLILLYSTIRFKFEFALGAVLAIMHDALIMITFIVWSRMEFNTTTIAAILTILGYSINDTIVQFDRVREERKLRPTEKFADVLNSALTHTLGRTIITTVTTMLAVLSLFLFTTGNIKDFALSLLVGMTSGAYSTIFIASAFVMYWNQSREKKGHTSNTPAASTAGKAETAK